MALQQKLAGNSAIYIFPLCVLFVFLVLAALYESWSLPLAIILIVPMCLFSAIGGVWLRSMENNIFTQIGFVVLVGLACKNAILIVEFAKQIQDRDGKDRFTAAVEACAPAPAPDPDDELRLHPRRAPARSSPPAPAPKCARRSGTAVFFGMLGVTCFGLFLTPVFYVVIMWFKERRAPRPVPAVPAPEPVGA